MRLSYLSSWLCVFILLGSSTSSQATSYTVTNTNDSGTGSLRQAIEEANNNPSDDTITFDTSANGTINLQTTLTVTNNGTLTITGNGVANTVLSGDSNTDNTGDIGVLKVNSGANLTLEQLTITKGSNALGGGIYNSGTLTVSHASFSQNSASVFGGGILNYNGSLTISDTSFSQNSALSGGGISNGISSTTLGASVLTVSNSTFSNNSSSGGGGGIFNNGTLTISSTAFSQNSTSDHGGGIFNFNGLATLSDASFSQNSALMGGGISNGTLSLGGYSDTSALTISNSTLNNNSATGGGGGGGGIYSGGTLTINNSAINNNSTTNSNGGGVYNSGGTITVNNSAISYNISSNDSPFSVGGGVFNYGALTVNNSTISYNSATYSGGILQYDGTLTLNNSIIANNINQKTDIPAGMDCTLERGTINAQNNLIEDSLACINGTNSNNLTGDPLLNADLTLQASSPAIDAGDNSLIPSAITTDLAGNRRIQNGTVDMGAYEVNVPLLTLSPATVSVSEGNSTALTLTRDGSTANALTVNLSITLGTGTTTSDYTLSGGSLSAQSGSATVTIPAGSASVVLTLAATDDVIAESAETLTLTLVDDASYDPDSSSNSATATIVDNDTAGITVTPTSGLTTTEAGGTASFTVVLTSQPTADVVIALSSNDTSEGTVNPTSLTFTSANWNTAQTVTVTGVDDTVFDSAVGYSIALTVDANSDATYAALTPSNVSVTNTDDDAGAGIPTLSEWALWLLATLMLGIGAHVQRRY